MSQSDRPVHMVDQDEDAAAAAWCPNDDLP